MSKIASALSDEEWRRLEANDEARLPEGGGVRTSSEGINIWTHSAISLPLVSLPVLIAVANAALPANSPRKITRRQVALLRGVGSTLAAVLQRQGVDRELTELTDALEAYLPPDPVGQKS